METSSSRRLRTLSDEKLDSSNLRDFLRVKDDDNDGVNSLSGQTLRAVLASGKRTPPVQMNRTLLDIIKDDPNYGKESRKSWKALKNKLRLRRAGAAWTSSVPTPTSDMPIQNNSNRMITRRNSTRFNSVSSSSDLTHPVSDPTHRVELNSMPSNNRALMLRRNSSRVPSLSARGYGRGFEGSASLNNNGNENGSDPISEGADEEVGETEEEEVGETEEAEGAEEGGEPSVRMSLMALLAETDRQMGLDGSIYIVEDDDDEEEEEEEVVSGGGGGVEYNNCCVCMVRHKGSAFIPCGHTFCRLCSRELWVQRGNCPLCNGFILEILDIF